MERIEGEKMELELHVVDVVDDHKIKMEKMCLKIRKTRKYAIDNEAWYHYWWLGRHLVAPPEGSWGDARLGSAPSAFLFV